MPQSMVRKIISSLSGMLLRFVNFFFNAGNNDSVQSTLVEGAPLTPQ